MKILETKDWKNKIAFDNVTYKNVKRYSLMLNTYEREIMEKQIEFYRKHFSLQQVMTHFRKLKTKKDKEIFIKAVLKRQDNIFYIPNEIRSTMLRIIRNEFNDAIDFFTILLNKGCNQKPTNIIKALYRDVLQDFYPNIVKLINKYRKHREIPTSQKMLKPEAIENTARTLIGELQNDYQLSVIYGRSSIRKSVPISIVDDYGYGEWISKNVSYNNNRFFIYSNHNRLTDVALRHMVYFNVYPGYAHFYNTVVDDVKKNICFDNGATLLINGWAMYAMCHNKSTAFSQNFMIEGASIAYFLLLNNLEKGYERAYNYLLSKYPRSKAIDYMLDYCGYPGHYLSYVLGALAIETSINSGFASTPVEFLHNLSTIDCGDYLCLYTPKMQKKIAKQIITSKVVNKFVKN